MRCCSRCRAIYRSDFIRCPTDGALIDEHEGDPLIGTTLGEHYVIEACVGEGAMGRVYRARHARLQRRTFAVKVLLGDLASTLAMRLRFSQEAEAASALDHPNVVRVTDFARSESGLLFIVMDYVEGIALADRIDQGPIPAAEAIALARGLCEGLAHAHDRGLVHRDFKPDNVILADGVPRIVDFGLAIASDPDGDAARLTSVGAAVGTPAYAAPEQAAGGALDHRADLFALGVTLYEMLAGTLPYAGNIAELIYQNATSTPPPIATRAPAVTVPPRLEAIVRRLMARKPADRYASARAVIAALDALEAPEAPADVAASGDDDTPTAPTPAPIADAQPAPARPARPWPWVIAVGAVAVAIAAVVVTRGGGRRVAATSPAPLDAAIAVAQADVPDRAVALDPLTPDASVEAVTLEPPDAAAAQAASAVPAPDGPRRPPRAEPSIDAGARAVVPPGASVDAAPPPRPPIDAGTTPPPLAQVDAAPPPPPRVRVDAAPPPPRVVDARASVGGLDVKGSLSSGQVRRAIDRLTGALAACYLPAATRAGRSPASVVRAQFTIDEDGGVRDARASGGALPGLAACVGAAVGTLRAIASPDVGTVRVSFTVTYHPESP
ncbi:MAG: protein kinase [Myxococcales bacterium]|nr:protein kinase [Myxococcales bacterium]